MATVDVKKTRLPRVGAIWTAKLGTAKPASNTEAFGPEWTPWGHLAPGAVTRNVEESTEDIKAYSNNETIDTIGSDASASYTVSKLEVRKESTELIWGTVVDDTDGSYAILPGAVRERVLFCWENVDTRTMEKERQYAEVLVTSVESQDYESTALEIVKVNFKTFGSILITDDKLKVVTP